MFGAAVLAVSSGKLRYPRGVREAPSRGISCSDYGSLRELRHVLALLLPDTSSLNPVPATNPGWNFSTICFSPASYTLVYSLCDSPRLVTVISYHISNSLFLKVFNRGTPSSAQAHVTENSHLKQIGNVQRPKRDVITAYLPLYFTVLGITCSCNWIPCTCSS
jgi:hypothetical protein